MKVQLPRLPLSTYRYPADPFTLDILHWRNHLRHRRRHDQNGLFLFLHTFVSQIHPSKMGISDPRHYLYSRDDFHFFVHFPMQSHLVRMDIMGWRIRGEMPQLRCRRRLARYLQHCPGFYYLLLANETDVATQPVPEEKASSPAHVCSRVLVSSAVLWRHGDPVNVTKQGSG